MTRRVWIAGLAVTALGLSLGGCQEVTTRTRDTMLTAHIAVTGSPFVENGDYLVGDRVRFTARVTEDGEEIPSGEYTFSSSNAEAVEIDESTGEATFVGPGTSQIEVTIGEPAVQGGGQGLQAMMSVTVEDLLVRMVAVSKVSTHLEDGDTLVTDSVALRSFVLRRMTEILKDSTSAGTVWTSSNPSVIRIESDTLAVFADTGTAVLSVSFSDLDLPGEPFEHTVRVTTFLPAPRLISAYTDAAIEDTLLSDSVVIEVPVIDTWDGSTLPGVVVRVEATPDSSRVRPVDNAIAPDRVVFADTGAATIRVTLSEPTLPQAVVEASLPLRVATYLASITPDEPAVIMGDTIDYNVRVTYTRPDGGADVTNPSVTFSSTDPDVIQVLAAGSGRALMRDLGQARVAVVVTDPSLPAATVTDTAAVTTIDQERFYGLFSDTTGTFGQMPGTPPGGDTVIVQSSAVHRFTDSTRVEFPNGRLGFIASEQPTELVWLVPAGADTGALVLRNLVDDQGGFRDNVPIRFDFNGPGTDVVDDFFEPNDEMPLALKDSIGFGPAEPFDALLAVDPAKAMPADSNFFYFRIADAAATVDIVAEWQVDADVDFKICTALGGPAPTGYDETLCQRQPSANSSDPRREEDLGRVLSVGRYVLAFYCNSASPVPNPCPTTFPLTYRVTIVQQ